jgi:uncharacterized protein
MPRRLRDGLRGFVVACCAGIVWLACGLGAQAAPSAPASASLQPLPQLTAHVTDQVGAMGAAKRAAIEQRLAEVGRQRGAQIAVLIVASVKPESIEQYSLRVVESSKLGRHGVDDGALLLIAIDDRALRIEVGYGLEGVLNDAVARRIIGEVMTPKLKAGDIDGAVEAGVEAIIGATAGEELPAPAATSPVTGDDPWQTLLFVGFILVFFVGGVLRALFGRLVAALLVGAAAGVIAWALVGALLVALGAGLVAFVVALVTGFAGGRGFPGGGGGGFGGFGGGMGGGGGFGGGGGSSGGGGGFGGGGASGRW